jgi:hypothetical protein
MRLESIVRPFYFASITSDDQPQHEGHNNHGIEDQHLSSMPPSLAWTDDDLTVNIASTHLQLVQRNRYSTPQGILRVFRIGL